MEKVEGVITEKVEEAMTSCRKNMYMYKILLLLGVMVEVDVTAKEIEPVRPKFYDEYVLGRILVHSISPLHIPVLR